MSVRQERGGDLPVQDRALQLLGPRRAQNDAVVPRHECAVVLQPAVGDLREAQAVLLSTVLELLQRRRARRIALAIEPRLRVLGIEVAARLRDGGGRQQLPRQEAAAGRWCQLGMGGLCGWSCLREDAVRAEFDAEFAQAREEPLEGSASVASISRRAAGTHSASLFRSKMLYTPS